VDNPLRHSPRLGRVIRADGPATVGISTQTLFEAAVSEGQFDLAADLLRYFWDEMGRIGRILFVWLEDIVHFRLARTGGSDLHAVPAWLLHGVREYDPAVGDRDRALAALAHRDTTLAVDLAEQGRRRYAALHDSLVVWIQELLTGIAESLGEEAVRESIELAYEHIWKPRYATWAEMTPLERLQLSVEGMRGHLSGWRRRGDVGVVDEPDRYVMVLDPCGSCGILRRGDPETGRPPYQPAGNREPHPWTWGRIGVGWYAVHSPIVMEFIHYRDGRPPLRPLEDCDTERPCRWFIYKDLAATRPEHAHRMGFGLPGPTDVGSTSNAEGEDAPRGLAL
jgi:hypothetical protein